MFLQARRAAALLDLPVSSFYQLVRRGELPPAASKVGRHQLWRQDDLVASVDPEGYKARHEQAQIAAGHPPASQGQRPGAILLAPGPGHPSRRSKGATAGQSPYAGILGGAGDGALSGRDWIEEFPDDGGPHG